MTKIIINLNNHQSGRPAGSTKEYLSMRDGYIIKAYREGMRRRVIADLMGLSYNRVCKVLEGVRND